MNLSALESRDHGLEITTLPRHDKNHSAGNVIIHKTANVTLTRNIDLNVTYSYRKNETAAVKTHTTENTISINGNEAKFVVTNTDVKIVQ